MFPQAGGVYGVKLDYKAQGTFDRHTSSTVIHMGEFERLRETSSFRKGTIRLFRYVGQPAIGQRYRHVRNRQERTRSGYSDRFGDDVQELGVN